MKEFNLAYRPVSVPNCSNCSVLGISVVANTVLRRFDW
jgi:hypothetical protein